MDVVPCSAIEVPKPRRPQLYIGVGWNDVDNYWSGGGNPGETPEEAVENYRGLEGVDPDCLGVIPASDAIDPIVELAKLGWSPKFVDWADGLWLCQVRLHDDQEEPEEQGRGTTWHQAAMDCLERLKTANEKKHQT